MAHAGINVASIAEKKTTTRGLCHFFAMIALFAIFISLGIAMIFSVYIFISLGISLNYLYKGRIKE